MKNDDTKSKQISLKELRTIVHEVLSKERDRRGRFQSEPRTPIQTITSNVESIEKNVKLFLRYLKKIPQELDDSSRAEITSWVATIDHALAVIEWYAKGGNDENHS